MDSCRSPSSLQSAPAEAKAREPKAGDAAPVVVQPAVAKAGDPNPADAKADDSTHGDTKTVDTKPVDTKTADATTPDAETADVKTARSVAPNCDLTKVRWSSNVYGRFSTFDESEHSVAYADLDGDNKNEAIVNVHEDLSKYADSDGIIYYGGISPEVEVIVFGLKQDCSIKHLGTALVRAATGSAEYPQVSQHGQGVLVAYEHQSDEGNFYNVREIWTVKNDKFVRQSKSRPSQANDASTAQAPRPATTPSETANDIKPHDKLPQQNRPRPDADTAYKVPIGNSPYVGPKYAKVTIVKAFEYACPFSERVGATLDQLRKLYGNDLRIVYKHFVVHRRTAIDPALASCAAARQGKFREMDKLIWEKGYNAGRNLKAENMEKLAKEVGLNMAKYKAAIDGACQQTIKNDHADMSKLGVSGTPAFFINGRFLSGARPIEHFKVSATTSIRVNPCASMLRPAEVPRIG
ncbi:MAG: DsbA family protein [Nannocystaceae bacterium]